MADRAVSRFERMMSLYDVHVENFLKTVGTSITLDLLRFTLEGKSILKFNRGAVTTGSMGSMEPVDF